MHVLSMDDAARRAGFCRRTLDRLIANGEGPSLVKISDRRRGVIDADLDAWLMARRQPAPGMARGSAK